MDGYQVLLCCRRFLARRCSTPRWKRPWQRCCFFILVIIFTWHQGYFFLADIFIKEEAKMIAERISAQVFNQQAWSKFDKWLEESCVLKWFIKQGGWHGWRKFQLAKKEPESRHQHCFYFHFLSTSPCKKNFKIIQRKLLKCFSPENLQLAHLLLLCSWGRRPDSQVENGLQKIIFIKSFKNWFL